MRRPVEPRTAVVTGATGQDGYYLVRRLLADGWTVHAAVRDVERGRGDSSARHERLRAVRRDIRDPGPLCALVGDVRPEELYNLAGESSVGASFADPRATWESNAHVVVAPARRGPDRQPGARASTRRRPARCSARCRARASSTTRRRRSTRRARTRPRRPPRTCSAAATASRTGSCASPAGSSSTTSRAAAAPQFLSRKVVDHVQALRAGGARGPLALGNLKAQRDWGFAPDYVDGMVAILRQAAVRGVPDEAALLPRLRRSAPGSSTTSGSSPTAPSRSPASSSPGSSTATTRSSGRRDFADSGEPAVVVDPAFIRPVRPEGDRRRPEPDRRRARLAAAARARRVPRGHARSRADGASAVEQERQLGERAERRAAPAATSHSRPRSRSRA